MKKKSSFQERKALRRQHLIEATKTFLSKEGFIDIFVDATAPQKGSTTVGIGVYSPNMLGQEYKFATTLTHEAVTGNMGELCAINYGLKLIIDNILDNSSRKVRLFSDSSYAVEVSTNKYLAKGNNIGYGDENSALFRNNADRISVYHIPRECNTEADKLSKAYRDIQGSVL